MDFDSQTGAKIQELQNIEQQLQSFLMQKQSMQIELNESLNALEEVKKSSGEVYKIVSGVMIKANKDKIIEELGEKRKVSELRINSIEKQEKILEEKAEKLRKEINDAVSKNAKKQ